MRAGERQLWRPYSVASQIADKIRRFARQRDDEIWELCPQTHDAITAALKTELEKVERGAQVTAPQRQ